MLKEILNIFKTNMSVFNTMLFNLDCCLCIRSRRPQYRYVDTITMPQYRYVDTMMYNFRKKDKYMIVEKL